jgi:hypothetical protein
MQCSNGDNERDEDCGTIPLKPFPRAAARF